MGSLDHADHPQNREQQATDSEPAVGTQVVVGIDGSETSWDALWWATGQVHRMAGRIVAAYVSPTVDANIAMASTFPGVPIDYAGMEQIATDRAEQLRHEVEDYAAENGIRLRFVHAHGDPMTELTRIAAESRADTIVVGRSTKARHHLAGSLGRRLIGQRKAPIVVVVP